MYEGDSLATFQPFVNVSKSSHSIRVRGMLEAVHEEEGIPQPLQSLQGMMEWL